MSHEEIIMSLKVKSLSAAIVAAGAMLAGSAFAINVGDTPDLEIWMSGASAQDALIQGLFPTLCLDTPITFTDTAGKAGVDFSAFFCTMDGTKVTGLSGTKKVLLHKRSRGGSAWGVAPVALAGVAGQTLARVNVSQMEISFTGPSGGNVPGNNCALDSGTRYVCNPNNTVDRISDAGVSDVEPAMFVGPNLIPVGTDYGTVAGDAGTFPLSSAQLGKLKISPMSAVTFGVVVTKDLRDALQRAQGKTPSDDSVDQMPSLTTQQIRSLFTGAVYDWGQFSALKQGGNPANAADWLPLTDPLFHPATTLTDSTVNICRRDPGSGTQAQFNARFLDAPCNASAIPVVSEATLPSPTSRHISISNGTTSTVFADNSARDDVSPGAPVVHETAASGDLTNCLNDLENNVNGGGHYWGIGLQGVTSANAAFRFVAVDGVTPTLNNVASGKYHDWAANTIQYLKSVDAGGTGAGVFGVVLTGDKQKIIDKIIASASSPTLLDSAVNKANGNITGVTKVGALALSTKGFAPSTPYAISNPVLPISTQGPALSSTPNTCRPSTLDGINSVKLEIISSTSNN
jgi:ABC-type phosphate transport system substrate-binding protein